MTSRGARASAFASSPSWGSPARPSPPPRRRRAARRRPGSRARRATPCGGSTIGCGRSSRSGTSSMSVAGSTTRSGRTRAGRWSRPCAGTTSRRSTPRPATSCHGPPASMRADRRTATCTRWRRTRPSERGCPSSWWQATSSTWHRRRTAAPTPRRTASTSPRSDPRTSGRWTISRSIPATGPARSRCTRTASTSVGRSRGWTRRPIRRPIGPGWPRSTSRRAGRSSGPGRPTWRAGASTTSTPCRTVRSCWAARSPR